MALDEPPALQAERTGMAWVRTLVGLAGAWGLVGLHAFADHGWSALGAISLAVAALVLVVAGTLGARRIRHATASLAASGPAMLPAANAAVTLLAAAAAVLALASTLAG